MVTQGLKGLAVQADRGQARINHGYKRQTVMMHTQLYWLHKSVSVSVFVGECIQVF